MEMIDIKRKRFILTLGFLYILPLALAAFMLFYALALLADKAPADGHIIQSILIILILVLGCFTYLSFYITEKKNNKQLIWITGIINAIVLECVFIYLFFDSISSANKSLEALVMGLIIVYKGIIAYLNYRLYNYDAKRIVENV